MSIENGAAETVRETVAIDVLSRAHSITASLDIPTAGAEGVIVCHGSDAGGYTLFIQDHHLHYVHNYFGALELHIMSSSAVPTGPVRVRVEFEPAAKVDGYAKNSISGRTQLYFNDFLVAEKEFPVTIPLVLGDCSGLSIGRNEGSPVSRMYDAPFRFTGKIRSVRYDLSDRMLREADRLRAFARANREKQ